MRNRQGEEEMIKGEEGVRRKEQGKRRQDAIGEEDGREMRR